MVFENLLLKLGMVAFLIYMLLSTEEPHLTCSPRFGIESKSCLYVWLHHHFYLEGGDRGELEGLYIR